MTDAELGRLIKEKKRKYIPTLSNQIFHGGMIILGALAIGLLYFQIAPIPPDVKIEDVRLFRQGLGLSMGAVLAFCGSALYLIWIFWRVRKAIKEANAEILAASLAEIKKK